MQTGDLRRIHRSGETLGARLGAALAFGPRRNLAEYNYNSYLEVVPHRELVMVRRQTLKKIGGSVATVLPKSMLDRFHLEAGDEVNVIETSDGLLITPFDPDFASAMTAYERGAKKYRNALRELAR